MKQEEPKQKVICTNYICQGECGECNFMTTVNIEEPKQETLEEIIKPKDIQRIISSTDAQSASIEIIKLFAKWQQQQNKNLYSEQNVTEYAYYFESCYAQRPMQTPLTPSEWFEQFKKK